MKEVTTAALDDRPARGTGANALRRAGLRWLPRLAVAGRVLAILAFLVVVSIYRTPLVASLRGVLLAGLALGLPLGLALEVRALRGRQGRGWGRRVAVFSWSLLLGLFGVVEGRFRLAKARVLAASPAELAAIGGHMVVGFHDLDELRELARRGGIAGVYVSRRNLEQIDPAKITATLAELQAARRDRGLPPLLVAGDQEGGVVSHLSPPLTRLPQLSSLVDDDGRSERGAILDYADTHGRELRSLGINLNFAPVVDLQVAVDRAFDRFTKIEARAISADPAVIAAVAEPYCEGLRERRVACTLKHFPGIGRVREDTHYFAGHLHGPRDELEEAEWRPFRALMAGSPPSTLVMLSHTVLDAIDGERPASMSAPVVDGLLRREWGYDGVLITDDLSMFPIALGPGVGEASIRGLAAGVDLLLISYDPDLYYVAVDELLDRWEELPPEQLARSRRRIAALQTWLADG
jgi:beta-N-acetylhexosaminidase